MTLFSSDHLQVTLFSSDHLQVTLFSSGHLQVTLFSSDHLQVTLFSSGLLQVALFLIQVLRKINKYFREAQLFYKYLIYHSYFKSLHEFYLIILNYILSQIMNITLNIHRTYSW